MTPDPPRRDWNPVHGRPSLRAWMHLAAILVLAAAATARFHPLGLGDRPRTDERVYLDAFDDVARGESPYAGPNRDGLAFYYPPPFAALGAAAREAFPEATVLLGLRLLNLVGLAACLWCSFLFAPLAWPGCLALAVAYVALAPPPLVHGLAAGNVSLAVTGAILTALVAWPRYPLVAGGLLGIATVTKPVTPAAIAALGAHRPRGRGGGAHLVAAAVAVALAAAATAWSPFLGEYLELDGEPDAWPLSRSVSLYRWLHLLGLPVAPLPLVLAVALASAWLARRGELSRRRLFVLAVGATTLAAPAQWSHSLLVALPLQVLAVATACRRLGRTSGRGPAGGALRRWEPVLVLLAVAALQLADGIAGGLEVAPTPLQVAGLAVPLWAPVALAIYVWRRGDPAPPTTRSISSARASASASPSSMRRVR